MNALIFPCLKLWWCPPLYRWAFREALASLERGEAAAFKEVLWQLGCSDSVRYSSTLLQLLLLLPHVLVEANPVLETGFPKGATGRESIRDRIRQCQEALQICFKIHFIDYRFLAKTYPEFVAYKEAREQRMKEAEKRGGQAVTL